METQDTGHPVTDAIENEINDMQRLADEARLKINLGSKDAKDAWKELELRLDKLTVALKREGKQLKQETLAAARKLRDDLRAFLTPSSD